MNGPQWEPGHVDNTTGQTVSVLPQAEAPGLVRTVACQVVPEDRIGCLSTGNLQLTQLARRRSGNVHS